MKLSPEDLEYAQFRYQGERFVYMTRNPEIRLQLDADACHDVAADLGYEPVDLARALELDEEVVRRIDNPAIELDYANCSWQTF